MIINGFTGSEEIFNKNILSENKRINDVEESFSSKLKEKLGEVNEIQIIAEQKQEAFIKGEDVDIHELMLTSQEAKLSLQLAVEMRNKLVEAYQEISRMQL